MSTTAGDALLDRVAAIGPIIREHAGEAEAGRRIAPPVLDAMRETGLFRMLLPSSLGGLEVDPVTFVRVAEALARHDSAAAWVLQAGTRAPGGGAGSRTRAASGSRAAGRSRAPSATRGGCS